MKTSTSTAPIIHKFEPNIVDKITQMKIRAVARMSIGSRALSPGPLSRRLNVSISPAG
jgi:hypothetical protein